MSDEKTAASVLASTDAKPRQPQQPLSPELKAGFAGFVVGAAAVFFLGFFVAGWVTTSTAKEQARVAVIAALVPICVGQAKSSPQAASQLVELKQLEAYRQTAYVTEHGWATMPGSSSANGEVAAACATLLDVQ